MIKLLLEHHSFIIIQVPLTATDSCSTRSITGDGFGVNPEEVDSCPRGSPHTKTPLRYKPRCPVVTFLISSACNMPHRYTGVLHFIISCIELCKLVTKSGARRASEDGIGVD